MLIRYTGKRKYIANDFCHVRYAFSKENNHTCDVPDDVAARQLIASGLYMPVLSGNEKVEVKKPDPIAEELGKLNMPEKEPENELKCKVCGRACKSALGLQAHMRSHKEK